MIKTSIRKYAAILGVSHTAVAKAIKADHISKGWDKEQKKIIVEIANNEWGNGVKEKNNKKNYPGKYNNNSIENTQLTEKDFTSIPNNVSISEARRLKEFYNAEIARITALKEQGLYVEKQQVYSQLFEFGNIIKSTFLQIPDRIIDSILMAKNRNEAQIILANSIHEALELLAGPPELNRKD